jgi:hypothetical protein
MELLAIKESVSLQTGVMQEYKIEQTSAVQS